MSDLRVLVFGDSVGKGIIKPVGGRYKTANLDLNELIGREDITIKNYSMFGCTVTKALSVVDRHIDEIENYDTTFIEIGGNDCDFDWQAISDNPNSEHLCNTPLEEFHEKYYRLLSKIIGAGGHPVTVTLPPLVASRFFETVSKNRDKEAIMDWVKDVNYIYRWQEMYNLQIAIISAKMNVPCIDIRSAFLKIPTYSDLICEDGIHPNEAGHELIYRTIAEQHRLLGRA
ncbi:MAG: SGNH/GDSL hydrolase family protein [Anaerovoracaceae bacterium]